MAQQQEPAIDARAIFKAVRDQWLADANLVAVVPDLYFEVADKSVDFPLATMFGFTSEPDYTLGQSPDTIERISWSFGLYDSARSLTTLLSIPALVSVAFDEKTLTFGQAPEYSTIIIGRGVLNGPEGVEDGSNRIIMDYEGMIQRA